MFEVDCSQMHSAVDDPWRGHQELGLQEGRLRCLYWGRKRQK